MANNNDKKVLNVPNLRFPEFTEEWKKCTIKDYGEVITGNTPPTKNIEYYSNGSYLWASPADLGLSKHITSTKTKLSLLGLKKTRTIPQGSILVTCIGSTIGKMGMATETMSTNQQINSVIVNDSTNNDFAYYAILNAFPRYLSEVGVQAVPILSKSNFEKLPNHTTTKEEQRKLGYFLNLLDERIATQNKIIERYQSLIRALALKLTSQFKETRPLSDLVQYTPSTLKESDSQETGEVPVYGASGICGYVDFPLSDKDSILITKDGSGVGTIRYVSGQHAFVGTLASMSAKEGTFLPYVYFALMNLIFTAYKTGLAIPHIYFKDYGKAEIPCPVYEEQVRIATGLMEMEEKLGIEHSMLNNLQKQKNVLLKKLFI